MVRARGRAARTASGQVGVNQVAFLRDGRYFVESGGLASQISSIFAVAPVLRRLHSTGDKPRDLPVQPPTKFGMVLALKTAKAMDLDVPANLLGFGDGVSRRSFSAVRSKPARGIKLRCYRFDKANSSCNSTKISSASTLTGKVAKSRSAGGARHLPVTM